MAEGEWKAAVTVQNLEIAMETAGATPSRLIRRHSSGSLSTKSSTLSELSEAECEDDDEECIQQRQRYGIPFQPAFVCVCVVFLKSIFSLANPNLEVM